MQNSIKIKVCAKRTTFCSNQFAYIEGIKSAEQMAIRVEIVERNHGGGVEVGARNARIICSLYKHQMHSNVDA